MNSPSLGSRQFEEWRAVEVTKPKYGSAYRIGGRLVLTACHLVGELEPKCYVRSKQSLEKSFGEVEATVVWKSQVADIALVELPEGIEPCKAAVLGQLPKKRVGISEFEMYGYPKWAQTKREQGKLAAGGRYIQGLIYWADTSPDGLLVLEAQRLPPEVTDWTSASQWAGASGAAIVCDGLVIAVQSQHQNPLRPASLEASLLWSSDSLEPPDEQWCTLLAQHGINPKPLNVSVKVEGEIKTPSYFFSSEDWDPKGKGQYLYDPTSLNTLGPAQLFPHIGEDSLLIYLLANWLKQRKLSQPCRLLLYQLEQICQTVKESWRKLATLLVDFEVFQSEFFNFNLPGNESFNSDFVRLRRDIGMALMSANKEASKVAETAGGSATDRAHQQRLNFYLKLEECGLSRPVIIRVHERDGGLSDLEFARQRLAGQNPMALRQIQQVDQALLQTWATQVSKASIDLIQAAAANRLFVTDYPLLSKLTPSDLQDGRYVGSPIAVFYRGDAGLEPVLIQVEPGRFATPIQPDVDRWMQAKLFVQTSDVTYHELIVHLCDTHLAMEAFAIAIMRQLPTTHPVYRLLRPHFLGLLAINKRSNTILLSEGAAFDRLMALTRGASVEIINQAYRSRSFPDYAFPNEIAQRGLTPEVLPEFPYRDDALLLWQAIERYVTHYLQRYYPDDQAVRQDSSVQAWTAELGEPLADRPDSEFPQAPSWLPEFLVAEARLQISERPNAPRVPGFPSRLLSLKQLIEIATQIIFTCGPQHAAVNFSQFDYIGYVPNAPLALYDRPDTTSPVHELLPDSFKDLEQMQLSFVLSGICSGRLGSSELIQFVNSGDRLVLHQFQADLGAIEKKITTRNQQRLADCGVAYPYLLPSRIPNSINI